MGVDDYHVSVEDLTDRTRTKREQKVIDKYKQIETLAYKYFDGEIDDKRMAEAVFGIVNGGGVEVE